MVSTISASKKGTSSAITYCRFVRFFSDVGHVPVSELLNTTSVLPIRRPIHTVPLHKSQYKRCNDNTTLPTPLEQHHLRKLRHATKAVRERTGELVRRKHQRPATTTRTSSV